MSTLLVEKYLPNVRLTGGVKTKLPVTLSGTAATLAVGGTLTVTGASTFTGTSTYTGLVASSSPTAGNGYSTGAGGTVTQATSKATGVTLNKVCGQITMNNAALASAAIVGFTVTDSAVAATDVVNVCIQSVATTNSYMLVVDAVAAGSFHVLLQNISAGSLSEAIVFNFAVQKAVTA